MSRRRWIALAGATAVLVWGAACTATALTALDRSQAGRDALRSTQRDVGLSQLLDGTVVAELDAAADAFEDAYDGATSPVWVPLRPAPVIGRHLASARALTRTLRDTARRIAEAGARAEVLIDTSRPGPSGRVAVVQGLQDVVDEIAGVIEEADLGPDDSLLGSFRSARAKLATELASLAEGAEQAGHALNALNDLLEGPSTNIVFAANNAEMRSGAGMLLSVGELRSQDGRGEVSDFVPVEDVVAPAGSVELPEELEALWGWAEPDQEIRNLLLSPRFPVAAGIAAEVWTASGRAPVDGVLAIDPVAIGELVEVTGPVQVGEDRFDGATIVDELLHEQYVRFGREDRPERQERSAEIASAVLRQVIDGDWDLVDMVQALERAVDGRHLLAWSRHEAVQAGWEALGAEGDLDADSLLIALNNRAAGKTDPFVRVDAAMTSETGDEAVEISVALCIRNGIPDGEPPTVTNDRPAIGLSSGDYRAILTASLPAAARSVRFEGIETLNVAGADGPSQVIGYQLQLPRGTATEVVLRFELPATWSSLVVEPSARVPAIRWSDERGQWRDRAAKRRPFAEGADPEQACPA
ncbi:MAG: DUF4012 domain-containing protein [Acidimicrobiales bacterium]